MNLKNIFGLLVVAVILVLAASFKFGVIPFKDDFLTTIPNLFGLLFFAALLLERAMDVLLTVWRAPKSEEMDEKIARFNAVLKNEQTTKAQHDETHGKLMEATEAKRAWRTGTRNISMWLGLTLGLIIAAVGVRTLGAIIDVEQINNPAQRDALAVVDILLTGGLIAGGSDGIHKIADLYRNFFESRSAIERQKALEQKG